MRLERGKGAEVRGGGGGGLTRQPDPGNPARREAGQSCAGGQSESLGGFLETFLATAPGTGFPTNSSGGPAEARCGAHGAIGPQAGTCPHKNSLMWTS